MDMQWFVWSSVFLMVLIVKPAFAWRCDHGLVNIGDSAGQVQKNAARLITNTVMQASICAASSRPSTNTGIPTMALDSDLQELKFHKGKLEVLNSPGYGFRADTKRCTPQDINIGTSAYALAVRCGKPKSKRDRDIHISGGKDSSGKQVKHTEEWTYDFGSQYLLQKVTIAGGHVQVREALSRSKHTDAVFADAGDK
jgi:Protein of unknown function (DUF2845)